jgi:xylan 1,4-beta-xylosidase
MRLKAISFDFISVSAFHTEGIHHVASLTTNPNYLSDKLSTLKSSLKLENEAIILAEWCFDVSTRNYLHDSIFMASFITKNLIENSNAFSDLSYWLMSDLMIEFSDTNQLLFGGNGLLSVDGLPKPSYFAYLFYRRLGKRVINQGDGYIITSNSMDTYQVLLYNYQHPKETYCTQYSSDFNYNRLSEVFNEPKNLDISIRIKNLVNGHYKIKTYLLSEAHGSILNEWITLGAIKNLSSSEITYLKNITQPSMHVEYTKETDTININKSLKPFELVFIQISLEYQEI